MRINSISNQNTQNKQSFKGVNIFRNDWTNMLSIGIWAKKEEDGLVQYCGGRNNYPLDLGNSDAAKTLTEMLRNIGSKITETENMKKVRELLNQVVGVDILPEAEKVRDYHGVEKYTFKNKMGGDVALADLKTIAQKGMPEYHPQGSKSKGSYEILAIALDEKEQVNVTLTREELAQLGKPQP